MIKLRKSDFSSIKNVDDLYFEVEERKIYYDDIYNNPYLDNNFKGIVKKSSDKLLSIVNKNYTLATNKSIVEPLINELENFDTKWYIDPSHSFYNDKRMRLQITFPELSIDDDHNKSGLSLFVHNSYDMSEGVRLYWGAIRHICTNGMVFGKAIGQYYGRHSKNLSVIHLKESLKNTYDKIPVIQERIKILDEIAAKEHKIMTKIPEFGKGIENYVGTANIDSMSLWQLYNVITYYISHYINLDQRAKYQIKASKVFEL